MSNLPDFKDENGLWVRYNLEYLGEGKTKIFYTRSGRLWHNLTQRLIPNGSHQKRSPKYIGCTSEFIDYQDFAEWCNEQIGFVNPDWELDKDVLFKGNKIYSRSTCVFLPPELNKLLLKRDSMRGEFPIGVTWNKSHGAFNAQVRVENRQLNLGDFDTPEAAFNAYKCEKEKYIKSQANKWNGIVDPRVVYSLMNYVVENTD